MSLLWVIKLIIIAGALSLIVNHVAPKISSGIRIKIDDDRKSKETLREKEQEARFIHDTLRTLAKDATEKDDRWNRQDSSPHTIKDIRSKIDHSTPLSHNCALYDETGLAGTTEAIAFKEKILNSRRTTVERFRNKYSEKFLTYELTRLDIYQDKFVPHYRNYLAPAFLFEQIGFLPISSIESRVGMMTAFAIMDSRKRLKGYLFDISIVGNDYVHCERYRIEDFPEVGKTLKEW